MKTGKKILTLMLSILMVISSIPIVSVSSAFAAQTDKIEFTVNIVDINNEKIEAVTVSLGSEKEITDANGQAVFLLDEGNYNLIAEKDGYKSEEASVNVNPDNVMNTVALKRQQEIKGKITSNVNEKSFENLNVTVKTSDNADVENVEFNNNGYSFIGLEGEVYTVTASAENYVSGSVDVSIDSASDIILNLQNQTVTVKVSGNGEYTINKGTEAAGKFVIDAADNSEATITAISDEGYHISKIVGVNSDYNNDSTVNDERNSVTELSRDFSINSSKRTIDVTFEINQYDISVLSADEGSIKVLNSKGAECVQAAHGEKITIVAEPGTYRNIFWDNYYNVESIIVNGNEITLNNVTENDGNNRSADYVVGGPVSVAAKFNKVRGIKLSELSDIGLSFNAVNSDGNTYYYKNKATIESKKYWIDCNNNKNIIKSKSLSKTEKNATLYVSVDGKWYYLTDDNGNAINYDFIIDSNAPDVVITADPWSSLTWTDNSANADQTIKFEVLDNGDSGLEAVYYSQTDSNNIPEDAELVEPSNGEYSLSFNEPQEKTYYIYAVDNSENVKKQEFTVRIDDKAPMVTDISFSVAEGETLTNLEDIKYVASNTVTVNVTAKDENPSSEIKSFELSLDKFNEHSSVINGKMTAQAVKGNNEEKFTSATASFTIEKDVLLGVGDFSAVTVTATDGANNTSDPTNDAAAENNYKNYLLMISTEKPSATITPSETSDEPVIIDDKKWYSNEVEFTINVKGYSENENLGTGINNVKIYLNDFDNPIKEESFVNKTDSYEITINTNDWLKREGLNKIKVVATANNGEVSDDEQVVYIDRVKPYSSEANAEAVENGWFKSLFFGNFSKNEINISVTAKDEFSSSGIKEIRLWRIEKDAEGNSKKELLDTKSLESNTEKETVFSSSINNGVCTANAKFNISPSSYNNDDIFVGDLYVQTVDNVNNESAIVELKDKAQDSFTGHSIKSNVSSNFFNLETEAPEISTNIIESTLNVNKNTFPQDQIWYGADQDITVEFTDKNEADSKKTSGLNEISATANGEEIFDESFETGQEKIDFVSKSFNTSDYTIDENNHFSFEFKAVDNAGNDSSLKKEIYIDKAAPEITDFDFSLNDYQDSNGSSDSLLDENGNPQVLETDYGYFFKSEVKATITASDKKEENESSSGVKSIEYKLIDQDGNVVSTGVNENGKTVITTVGENDYTGVQNVNSENKIEFSVPEGFKGQLVARATDNVDHTGAYKNPDGVIFETTKPEISFAALKNENGRASGTKDVNGKNDLFAKNAVVEFTADDSDKLSSGIRTIEWAVEAPYDTENNKSGVIRVDEKGNITSDGSELRFIKNEDQEKDHNLVHSIRSAILVTNNSNDIKVTVKVTDRAGNTDEKVQMLSIDKTNPSIDIKFVDGDKKTGTAENQYNTARTAIVTIKERNFNPALITAAVKNLDPDYSSVPNLDYLYSIKNWSPKAVGYNTENPDETTYTIGIVFQRIDGIYELTASLKDMVGNKSNIARPTVFVIDSINPYVSIKYTSSVEPENGNYYKAERTATITVVEHNFDEKLFINNITGKNNGDESIAFVQPKHSGFKSTGKDTYEATIVFKDNFEYSALFELSDKSGNKYDFTEEKFSVDTAKPELVIEGIKTASSAAYNNDIIKPILKITDKDGNIDQSRVNITLTGVKENHREPKVYNPSSNNVKVIENGFEFTLTDFDEKVIDTDDIYALKVEAYDLAGNVYTYDSHISVNRFGSTYSCGLTFDADGFSYTKSILDMDLFSEINCDFLGVEHSSLKLTYTNESQIDAKTIDLAEGTDYVVTEPDKENDAFNIKTYKYRLINKSLFSQDGIYELFLVTYDDAGNVNENNIAVKNEQTTRKILSFVVDNNAPVIDYSLSLENTKADEQNDGSGNVTTEITKGSIRDENFSADGKSATITLDISEKNLSIDAVDMNSVSVTYNDEEIKHTVSSDDKSITFTLNADEKGIATGHKLDVTVNDKAGNTGVLTYDELLVSNNWFVRFYNNKPAFIGTVVALIAVLALIVILIIVKRKREDEEED